ncbi:MAG: alpha/beta hydrolase [Clostridia bacterium]|nr:alpha/beta hydrolase [Clostridia bacterium]
MMHETVLLPCKEAKLIPFYTDDEYGMKLAPRPCVIVCPGGGYGMLSDREAEPIAAQFLSAHFATFILRYSVGTDAKDFTPAKQVALAIKHVREHASDYNLNPDRIFTCGFSAGGHLAGSAGVFWNAPEVRAALGDAPEGINRPNGMILCYPVITAGDHAHKGSFHKLCGSKEATQAEMDRFSLELHVDETTPPAFIWHTFNDGVVPIKNALLMADALADVKVPFELHIYPDGPHGLALCNEQTRVLNPHCEGWVKLAVQWVKDFQA